VILQFSKASVTTVGFILGVLLLAAGIQEIVVGALASGWKWLWYIFGGLCLVGGLVALFNPNQTVLVIADVLGLLLLVIGVFWIVEAFATMQTNSFWWLGLIAGIMMLGLGFWTSWQAPLTQAATLLSSPASGRCSKGSLTSSKPFRSSVLADCQARICQLQDTNWLP
jgi:hypothetical protein